MKINNKKDLILFGDEITFESVTAEQREKIFEYYIQHNYIESMNLIRQMIKSNIDFIMENTQEIKEEKNIKKKDNTKEQEKEEDKLNAQNKKPLLNFAKMPMDDLNKLTIEKIISTYLYYQEYFSNILLVVHIYIKMNYLDKIFHILFFLKNEMEQNKFCEIINIIIKFMIQNENNIESKNEDKSKKKVKPVPEKLYSKCEEIYFNALKIYVCCVQYAINIREFNLFEKFLLEFVMKISILLTKDNYIICNTFLLVGNLYLKIGDLKRAHLFFEKILGKNQHGIPKDKKMCKVMISANFNLGLIYYVTGKYATAKLKLENALEIKKVILKNNYDLELIKIYETLAEIDVQYKNYISAYLYIEQGTKFLNNKIENVNTSTTQRTTQRNKSLKNIIEKSSENDIQDLSSKNIQIISSRRDAQNEQMKNINLSNEELILYKKFNILKNYIGSKLSETLLFTKYDKLDEQKNNENNNLGNIYNYIQMRNSNINKRKERADDAEDNQLFKEFLDSEDNEQINDPREINQRELSTFILFITSLTEKQLKKLNSDQPKDYEYNKKHPIVFTKEFKDSLNGYQRYNFCQLRLSSLTRIRVLSDYNKKISGKNMNYKGLYKMKKINEIDKINIYVGGKNILGRWEHEHDPEKEEVEDSDTEKEMKWKKEETPKNEEEQEEKSGKKDEKQKLNYSFEQSEKYGFNNMMKLSKEIFVEGEDYVNFDRFKKFVLEFFKDNLKEELQYVTDEFLILITKDLDKNKIKKILFNPKLLYDLLVIYCRSKGIEIERPKKRLKAKGEKNENIIVLHAA